MQQVNTKQQSKRNSDDVSKTATRSIKAIATVFVITRGDNKLYWQHTFATEVDVAAAAGVQVSTAVSCWLV